MTSPSDAITPEIQERAIAEYRTNTRVRRQVIEIREMIQQGRVPEQELDELGISFDKLDYFLQVLWAVESRSVENATALVHYAWYALHQRGCIFELQEFIDKQKSLSGRANGTALVSAIKAKSDIFDRMMNTGQKLGVIHKAAETLSVISDLDDKTDEELVAMLENEIKSLQLLVGGEGARTKRSKKIRKKRKLSMSKGTAGTVSFETK